VAALLLLLAAVSFDKSLPEVKAESTDITDVSYPEHALFDLEHRTTEPPLLVKATVSYSDAEPSYFLLVTIFDLESGDAVRGRGSGAPEPCKSSTTYASCLIGIGSSSGIEFVEFSIAGFKPTMSLAIIAVLLDGTGSMIYESESDYEFAITMTSSLVLSIRVPSTVSVSVDGVPQREGNVWLNLIPGFHKISIPDTAQLDNVTRLKFERWSDGVDETNRTIQLGQGTMLAAIYAMQYLFRATSSEGNVTETGWYDEGSNATFSVPSTTMPMNGVVGLLGGEWKFQGWYENGELQTNSINGSIIMRQPHSLIARWEPGYTLPVLVFTIAVLTLIIASMRTKLWKTLCKKTNRDQKGSHMV